MNQFPPSSGGVPPITSAASAAARDPRIRSAAPYVPVLQADQQQIAQQQKGVADSIPFKEIIERLDHLNVPPQIHVAPFLVTHTVTDTPQLILPYNPNRMSFLIANLSPGRAIAFSFDRPVGIDSVGHPIGIPLAAQTFYQETNGTVTVNDIWVWALSVADGSYMTLAYEGTLSISGKFGGVSGG